MGEKIFGGVGNTSVLVFLVYILCVYMHEGVCVIIFTYTSAKSNRYHQYEMSQRHL